MKKIKQILRTQKAIITFDILINVCIMFLYTYVTIKISKEFNFKFFMFDLLWLMLIYILVSSIKKDKLRAIVKSIVYPVLLFMPYADLVSYDYYTQVIRYYEIKNIGVLFRTFQIGFTIPVFQIIVALLVVISMISYIYTQIVNRKWKANITLKMKRAYPVVILALIPFVFTVYALFAVHQDEPNYYRSDSFLVKDVYSNEQFIKDFGYSQFRFRKFFPTFKTKVDDEKELDNYFNSVKEKQSNDFTGKYEGYNVIHLLIESYDTKSFNKHSMPNLYGMYENSILIEDFYVTEYQHGATCNSEFMVNTSTYPRSANNTANIMCKVVNEDSFTYALPRQMQKLGYTTHYFHNGNASFYNRDQVIPYTYGYEYSEFTKDWKIEQDVSDDDLMEFVNEIDFESKFFTQILTYSMHVGGYSYTEEDEILFSETLGITDDEFYIDYLSKQKDTDKFVGSLLEKLREEEVLDKTLIVVSSDHYPYGFPGDNFDYMDTINYEYNHSQDVHKQSLIIYDGGTTKERHKIPSSTIDIAPTILNMVSDSDDDIVYKYYFGTDIFDYSAIPSFSNYEIFYKDDYHGFDYMYNGKHNKDEVNDVFLTYYHKRLLSDYAIKSKYAPMIQ